MRRDQKLPTLLLNRDGYEIHTIVNVGLPGYTAWILLYRDEYGTVREAATGWGLGYDRPRRNAYEAMKQHKADIAARDGERA